MGLVDKFQEGLGAATAASERMLQVAKLKSQVSSLRQKQEELYGHMGRAAALLVRRSEVEHPQLIELGAQIDEIEAQVVGIQSEIERLQAVQGAVSATCPSCSAGVAAGVKFCPSCGGAIPQPDMSVATADEVQCPKCHSPLEAGAKFCGKCGASLGAND